MTNRIQSYTLGGHLGIEARPVEVTASFDDSAMGLVVEGVATHTSKEIAVRVRSAIAAIDKSLPIGRTEIHLGGEVWIAKRRLTNTPALDLAIAFAILGVEAENVLVCGELGLDGSVRPVKGVFQAACLASALGCRGIVVPAANAREALDALAPGDGVKVHPIGHLRDAFACLATWESWEFSRAKEPARPDFSDVRGQADALATIENAAVAYLAGQPSGLMLSGPPGTGKTMLARRIPTILPRLTRDESETVTRYYSALGLADRLVTERPLRAPHHTVSAQAMVGQPAYSEIGQFGRAQSGRPGEVHLAAHGVLFLDEITEFPRAVLEAIAHALREMPVSSRPMIVAACNPCPCGWLGSGARECACTPAALDRHAARLKAIGDLFYFPHVTAVRSVSINELRSETPSESSADIRERVTRACNTHDSEEWLARKAHERTNGGGS